jgi:Uncharacterized protein, putative amidase
MRTVRFELLRPGEIQEEKERCPVVYFPVSPLEWHGPHLPVGMDPLNAEAIATKLAEKNGGVVLPTLFWGTERERTPEMLKNIGFSGDEWIVGMDFPKNCMPSLYASEEVFGVTIREYLRLLVVQGYKLIVMVNGHGGENHINTLERLAREFTETTDSVVIYTFATYTVEEDKHDLGHATQRETDIMLSLHPDSVDLTTLPPKNEKLYNLDYAIVDGEAFEGNPNSDFSVEFDPRDADAKRGNTVVQHSIEIITEKIKPYLPSN